MCMQQSSLCLASQTVILGEDTLGHEVRKDLQDLLTIADVVERVLKSTTPEERVATGRRSNEKATSVEKVNWVKGEAESYCLEGLRDLVRWWTCCTRGGCCKSGLKSCGL